MFVHWSAVLSECSYSFSCIIVGVFHIYFLLSACSFVTFWWKISLKSALKIYYLYQRLEKLSRWEERTNNFLVILRIYHHVSQPISSKKLQCRNAQYEERESSDFNQRGPDRKCFCMICVDMKRESFMMLAAHSEHYDWETLVASFLCLLMWHILDLVRIQPQMCQLAVCHWLLQYQQTVTYWLRQSISPPVWNVLFFLQSSLWRWGCFAKDC